MPAAGAAGSCAAQVKDWYIGYGHVEISNIKTTVADLLANEKSGPLATTIELGNSLRGYSQLSPLPACGDPAHAWPALVASYNEAGTDVYHQDFADSTKPLDAGNASLQVAQGEIAKVTPLTR